MEKYFKGTLSCYIDYRSFLLITNSFYVPFLKPEFVDEDQDRNDLLDINLFLARVENNDHFLNILKRTKEGDTWFVDRMLREQRVPLFIQGELFNDYKEGFVAHYKTKDKQVILSLIEKKYSEI